MDKNIYILSDKRGKGAKNLPVFEVQYIVDYINLKDYDALIFTSKNGVKAIDSMNNTWKNLPSYVIAPQTAKILKDLGGNLKFTGEKNHGDEFANEITDKLRDKKVLYICGEKTVSNLVNILNKNGVLCDSLVVYRTVCKKYTEPIYLAKNSIIIFSSPSTINCFLENITWDKSFKAVCIGNTTAKYLPEYIGANVSDSTSLESCVNKALELRLNN